MYANLINIFISPLLPYICYGVIQLTSTQLLFLYCASPGTLFSIAFILNVTNQSVGDHRIIPWDPVRSRSLTGLYSRHNEHFCNVLRFTVFTEKIWSVVRADNGGTRHNLKNQ